LPAAVRLPDRSPLLFVPPARPATPSRGGRPHPNVTFF